VGWVFYPTVAKMNVLKFPHNAQAGQARVGKNNSGRPQKPLKQLLPFIRSFNFPWATACRIYGKDTLRVLAIAVPAGRDLRIKQRKFREQKINTKKSKSLPVNTQCYVIFWCLGLCRRIPPALFCRHAPALPEFYGENSQGF